MLSGNGPQQSKAYPFHSNIEIGEGVGVRIGRHTKSEPRSVAELKTLRCADVELIAWQRHKESKRSLEADGQQEHNITPTRDSEQNW